MTLTEFKAWFDGFTEAIDKTPTQKQWARIKERVAEVDGAVTTERVYVERYWPAYPRPYWQAPYYATSGGGGHASGGIGTSMGMASGVAAGMTTTSTSQAALQSGGQYTPTAAMFALGKADAHSLAAA